MKQQIQMTKEEMLTLLKGDVIPALGCTEPVCVALCAANAGKVLGEIPDQIEIRVNAGIYKNGMSAGIPNCKEVGLPYAAALGAVLKNPEKGLELLEDVTNETLEQAFKLIKKDRVHVKVAKEEKSIFVCCEMISGKETSICEIRGAHTNVVYLAKNDRSILEQAVNGSAGGEHPLVEKLCQMRISDMRDLVDTVTEEELHFLLDGVEMNVELAKYSETKKTGVGIADAFRSEETGTENISGKALLGNDLMARIITKVASAAESRLDGCPLPTMSSSGAGTKGLVAILPVSETAMAVGASPEQEVRALALSHLVNRYINAKIGKLSPMCTCVMAASTAAAAGMAYLFGGTNEQIGYAVRNMTGTVTGMLCDGGKVGCSMKVATGSTAALMSAITAVYDAPLRASDGICGNTPEECISNMALIGKKGMADTDTVILEIMEAKS